MPVIGRNAKIEADGELIRLGASVGPRVGIPTDGLVVDFSAMYDLNPHPTPMEHTITVVREKLVTLLPHGKRLVIELSRVEFSGYLNKFDPGVLPALVDQPVPPLFEITISPTEE